MAVTLVNAASQLINTSGLFGIPLPVPTIGTTDKFSMTVWIKANWGTSGAPRGRKSFVGIYGPSQVTAGLMGYYFNNMTLSAPFAGQRADATVNFTWGAASPMPGVINTDVISTRWSGYFYPGVTGLHYFQTNSDDGVRLYVNNVLIIDQWNDHSATLHTGATNPSLTIGTPVPIVLEWYENGGDAVIALNYRTNTAAAYVTLPAYNGTFGMTTSLVPPSAMTAVQIGSATGAGEITAWTYGGTAMATTPANTMASYINKWVNVAYTWDGTTHRVYVDGSEVVNSTTTQFPGTLSYVTINGYYGGGAGETDTHSVGNMQVYNRVLPPEEIQTIVTAQGSSHTDLYGCIARYEFREGPEGGNVSTVYDMTANTAATATNLLMTGAGTAPKYTYDDPAVVNRRPVIRS